MWLCYKSFECIFLALFFLLMTLLAVYFIRILEYRNNVRQKANSSDFFYSCSKWVVKQQRQFTTPTTHLAQELLMTVQCSGGSRSFAKEMRALKMRSVVSSHRSWQRPTESIIETDPPTTTQEVAKELTVNHSMVIWHLKQIEKVKKLNKWVLHKLTANQKHHRFETGRLLLLYATTMNRFSTGLWHAVKSIRQSVSQACSQMRVLVTV